jgi:archaellin
LSLMSRTRWGLAVVLACAVISPAGDKKDKAKSPSNQTVDSGSFGIFVKGQRVLTETFSVHQQNGISVVKSRLQEAAGSTPVKQNSELQMTGAGELIRYEWTDGTGSLVLTPSNDFLLEKITPSPAAKAAEQPFLMPSTSAILDNNFFVHREVLAWRYLATNCQTEAGNLKCQQGPVEFGALVPQDRTSLRVRMELAGREKVTIRGSERELLRLNLMGEEFSWVLWVDEKDQFKLIRVVIPDANTEVVRD